MYDSKLTWQSSYYNGEKRSLARKYAFILLLVAILLTAYTRDNRELGVKGATIVGELFSPAYVWFSKGWTPWRRFFMDYTVLVDVKRENRQLQQRLAALKTRVLSLEEQRKENARLRGLLEAAPDSNRATVVGRVVAYDLTNRVFGVTIDKGRKDGVMPRNAVVNGKGVVGIVSATMERSAKVLLLVDPRSGVDVRTSESRSRGVVRGYGNRGLNMEYVSATRKIAVGEKVLTSGLDQVFPPGLLVGKIGEVSKGSQSLFRQVVVEPAVDFERLEEVLVIGAPEEE